MNICYSAKQAKVIKALLYYQDLDNANIQRLKVDISDMTLDEAHRIVNKMSQAKKDAMNNILLGKVQPLPRYDFENSGKVVELSKTMLLTFLNLLATIISVISILIVTYGVLSEQFSYAWTGIPYCSRHSESSIRSYLR